MAKTGSKTQGGAALVEFFTINAAHTEVGSAAVYSCDRLIQTQAQRGDGGKYTISWEQTQDDPTYWAFVETYAPVSTGSTEEAVTYEDGYEEGGATAGSDELLMLSYGTTIVDGVTTKRKIFAAIVKLTQTSGSFTHNSGSKTRPTLEAESQKALAAVAIAAKFNTNKAATSPLATLAANSKGSVVFQAVS